MLIEWRETPNPDALRFDLPMPLPIRDPVAVSRATHHPPPLAARLLEIEGVAHCLLARDFVAVTRIGRHVDWATLRTNVLFSLADSLSRPGEVAALEQDKPSRSKGDIELQIEDLLRTRVGPQVARDGGDIAFVDFKDGVVTVVLSGACGGCPSALLTLKRGVEATLMRYVPEIRQVVAKQERPGARAEPSWKAMLRGRGARFRDD